MRRLVLVVPWLALLAVAAAAVQSIKDPAELLPPDSELQGWKADGPARLFRGEELFDYIDGGAEIYREFGFRQSVTRDYAGPAGGKLILEIFEMEDDSAAFGMFTFFQVPGGREIPLGNSGQLADYYLNFWKGRFLVNITSDRADAGSAQSLLALAGTVEGRISDKGLSPLLVSRLPAANMRAGGLDYFEGSLGFMISAPYFGADVFGVRRGVKVEYKGGYAVFLLEFDGPQDCSAGFRKARDFLAGREGFRDASGKWDDRFQVAMADGHTATVSAFGPFILGGVALRAGTEVEAALGSTLEEARRKLVESGGMADGVQTSGPWRFGFSERVRYVTWDNAETLDKGQNLGRAEVFLRTRLSLQGTIATGLELGFRLTGEIPQVVVPSGQAFNWDEVIVDQLFIRWAGPAGSPLVLTLGRQGLFIGEGFLVAEGTPLDETRTDYFNALRLDWRLSGKRSLIFFACHQPETDSYLPVLNSRKRALFEQPVTGLGLIGNWKGEEREAEVATVFMKARGGSHSLQEMNVLTFDGRGTLKPLPEMKVSGEAALQVGKKGRENLSSWGMNARLAWDAEGALRIPLRASLGALYLSGDDPSSEREEGWVPLFSRWPQWSDSYIYTLAAENEGRIAWWSNFASAFGSLDLRLTEKLGLHFAFHRLAAPRAGSASWSRVSGAGRVRGDLWLARLDFRLSRNLAGHLLYESFHPGNYYVADADGYSFLRFELSWAL